MDARVLKDQHSDLVRNLDLTASDVDGFRQKGFIKLENFLTSDAIAKLTAIANQEVQGSDRSEFAKIAYDIGTKDNFLQDIYNSQEFRAIVRQLIGQPLIFTQGLGFGLAQGDTGFCWHTGVVSFSYINPADLGYTIWIPLTEINPQFQHGGMAYVPRNVLNGEYRFKL